jgi:lysophospholipase L1-like esterase
MALLVSASVLAADVGPVDVGAFKEPVRVACVGDSITAGVGTSKGNSYPDQLSRMLGENWVVKNFGNSGSTLLNHGDKPYQKQAEFKKALEFQPNVVVIKLGTNDTRPQNWKFKDEFVADYKGLMSQFAKLPSKPRIFLCPPAPLPEGKSKFGHNEARVLEEIPMIDQIATEERAGIIDIHGALKDHPEMFADKLHPNAMGATVMAKTVFKALTGKEFTGEAPLVAAPAGKKEKKK